MDPQIIFENDDFLAVNKPAGLLVHPIRAPRSARGVLQRRTSSNGTSGARDETLVDWLLLKYPELKTVGDDPETRPGIVHRLDKDTSGIILIPKTQKYYLYLKNLFQKHEIKKTYLALVSGVLENKEGAISKPIGIKEGTIKRSVHSKKQAKDAITNYKVLNSIRINAGRSSPMSLDKNLRASANISLLEVTPQTGRTHQIRVHLSSIGHPILGDVLYGNKESIALSKELNISHQMLHAQKIEFIISDGVSDSNAKIRLEAEPPKEFQKIIGIQIKSMIL